MSQGLLVITHPVDLGNLAFEQSLLAAVRFADDFNHLSFAAGDLGAARGHRTQISTLVRRVSSAWALRNAFLQARLANRAVLLQGISPALFTLPIRRGLRTFIILDWTRKLYEPIFKTSMSNPMLTRLHRRIMLSVDGLICLTDAVLDSLRLDYQIPERLLLRARMPFQVEKYQVSRTLGSPLRLLFVGGNFQRKGGDILLDWYSSRNRQNVSLTLVTQSSVVVPHGVALIKNDPAAGGFDKYSDFDILALPTRCDAYPQVIGEAACAGLAIATTKNALGAPEVVEPGCNGFIADSPAQFVKMLDQLVSSPQLVEGYKSYSRRKMVSEAAPDICWNAIRGHIFGGPIGMKN
jgi:hypothetical protein